MIYEALRQWKLLNPLPGGQRAGLVVHTSWVNFTDDDLEGMRSLGFAWVLPDNVAWELELLCRSRILGDRARRILQWQRQTPGGARQSWDLEQLYRGCRTPAAPKQLPGGPLIFLFGDLNKQDEFLHQARALPSAHILLLSSWNCAAGQALVQPLNQVQGWSFRHSASLEPGRQIPPAEQLPGIYSGTDGALLFPGRALQSTGMGGSYARVFACDRFPGQYLKIYNGRAHAGAQREKLRCLKLLGSRMDTDALALPRELLCTRDREVLGYTMPRCQGRPLRQFVGIGWQGHDLKTVFQNLLLLLLELHCLHVLVNDLSANNVLLDDRDRVSLVDCDSFQVLHLPGGGITETYQHPEISPRHYHDTLREPRHEYFALAVLLYQCLFYADPLQQVQDPDSDRKLSWTSAAFPLDTDGACGRVNASTLEMWNRQSRAVRRTFSAEFHFRGDNSPGAWVRALGLLDDAI